MLPINDTIGKPDAKNPRALLSPFAVPVLAEGSARLFVSTAVSDDPESATIPFPKNWDVKDVQRVIFPDHTATIAKSWGIRFTGKISRNGWMECHAFDREDETPSAAISKATGAYRDQGSGSKSISFFDLAVKVGAYKSFPEVVNALGREYVSTPRLKTVETVETVETVDENQLNSAKNKKNQQPQQSQQSQKTTKSPKFKTVYKTLSDAIKATAKYAGEIGTTWRYTDWFATVRFDSEGGGKKVLPFHKDAETGAWINADPPGLLPLLRTGTARPNAVVLVVEGEKCVGLAASIGFESVTSSHGANSAGKSDWTALAGREVVILPDANNAGEKYARDVEAILRQLDPQARTKIVRLPGLLPGSGDDIEQWIDSLGDTIEPDGIAAKLREIIATTPIPDVLPSADPNLPTREMLGLKCITEIEEQEIDWLWPDRFLMGSLNLIVGEGDVGKSFLTLDMIARITTGRPFPDQVEPQFPPARCIFITGEDRVGMAIRPRLRALGADQSKVFVVGMGKDEKGKPKDFTIKDVAWLDQIMAHEPDVKVIVIDPITSFYGPGVDENSNTDVRSILKPFGDFAERHNVAIIAISHFGKGQSGKPAAKILGSVALPNVARAVWCVVADQENRERRLMLRVKLNLSGKDTGLAYRITPELKIEWEPEAIETRAADAVADTGGSKREEKKEAKKRNLILDACKFLSNGRMKSDEMYSDLGISKATWFRIPESDRRGYSSPSSHQLANGGVN